MSASGAPAVDGIDVLVVSWKSRAITAQCLEHLQQQTVPHRVIVVDNASGDGTTEEIRSRWPEVTVIASDENIGFGRANNLAAQAGNAEAVVLVNSDLFVEPDFLEQIVAPLADPQVGQVAGLTLMPSDGPETIDSAGVVLDRMLCGMNHLRHEPAAAALTSPQQPSVPSGAAVAYRRSAYEAAGGFDPHLFAYGEDVDLGLRIAGAGWTCVLAPRARGVHLGGASMSKVSDFQRELSGTSRGFMLGRYDVGTAALLQAAITELLVVAVDLLQHRTLHALRGRLKGWRMARSLGARLPVPSGAVDRTIGPVRSIQLRRAQ
ncbi:MAG: glycosyltransferase family 2 protein [Solirubrobacteraceae bacterium]|nr:glycosyltransferase family 2 protein [Solirubrobacteraceae bacterium]